MIKLTSGIGYLLAALGVPILLATFIGAHTWMALLVESTGLSISPLYTGGEIAFHESRDGYRIDIHKPVFAALIGESKEGFVQVDFRPKAAVNRINSGIDYNDDGKADFQIDWTPSGQKANLIPNSPLVLGLEGFYELKDGYAIRVNLKNPKK